MEKLILTTQKGTMMTERGEKIFEEMSQYICSETQVPKSLESVAEYNHAILLRNLKFAIKQGVEQRDAAIKVGQKEPTTLLYNNGKFLIPGSKFNALKEEKTYEKTVKR